MNTCGRCGLTDETVRDLDTGSTCHDEWRDCARALRKKHHQLRELIGYLLPFAQGSAEACEEFLQGMADSPQRKVHARRLENINQAIAEAVREVRGAP